MARTQTKARPSKPRGTSFCRTSNIPNRHVARQSPAPARKSGSPFSGPTERQLCLAQIDSSAGGSVALFENGFSASSLKNFSKKTDQIVLEKSLFDAVIKQANTFHFNGVFGDKNFATRAYQQTLSATADFAIQNRNFACLAIGTRENRLKKRFLTGDEGFLQKFLCEAKLKFGVFQRGEPRPCELHMKASLVGFVDDRRFDFLRGNGTVGPGFKPTKVSLDTEEEVSQLIDKIKSSFSVLKTIGTFKSSFVIKLTVFSGIYDSKTKLKCNSGRGEFVCLQLAEGDLSVLQEVKEAILAGAIARGDAEEKYDRRESASRKSTFTDLTKVDELKLFVCVNALHRHLPPNKVILEWSREVQNDYEAHRLLDLTELETTGKPHSLHPTFHLGSTGPFTDASAGLEKMVALIEEFRLLTEDGTQFGQHFTEQKLLLEKAIDILDVLCLAKPLEVASFLKWAESVFEMLQGLYPEADRAFLKQRIHSIKTKTEASGQIPPETEISAKKYFNQSRGHPKSQIFSRRGPAPGQLKVPDEEGGQNCRQRLGCPPRDLPVRVQPPDALCPQRHRLFQGECPGPIQAPDPLRRDHR